MIGRATIQVLAVNEPAFLEMRAMLLIQRSSIFIETALRGRACDAGESRSSHSKELDEPTISDYGLEYCVLQIIQRLCCPH